MAIWHCGLPGSHVGWDALHVAPFGSQVEVRGHDVGWQAGSFALHVGGQFGSVGFCVGWQTGSIGLHVSCPADVGLQAGSAASHVNWPGHVVGF